MLTVLVVEETFLVAPTFLVLLADVVLALAGSAFAVVDVEAEAFLLVFFSANFLHNSASEIPSFFALAMWQNLISKVVKASKKLIDYLKTNKLILHD